MRFPTEVLFAAFKGAGFLKSALYKPGQPSQVSFDCQFMRPDELLLAGDAQGAQIQIEYQTADLPALKHGDPLQIDGQAYTVRQPPQAQGDGTYSRAFLNVA